MNIIKRFFYDLKIMENQFEKYVGSKFPYGLVAIGGLILIGSFYFLTNEFPYFFFFVWIGIPIIIFLMSFLGINIPKIIKILLILFLLFISLGFFSNKDELKNFIGENAIKGYTSKYVERPVSDVYSTQSEREVLVFSTDHWTGRLLLIFFDIIYWISLIIVPYITWKILMIQR